jgi:hypothetical protein
MDKGMIFAMPVPLVIKRRKIIFSDKLKNSWFIFCCCWRIVSRLPPTRRIHRSFTTPGWHVVLIISSNIPSNYHRFSCGKTPCLRSVKINSNAVLCWDWGTSALRRISDQTTWNWLNESLTLLTSSRTDCDLLES